jgi:MoaA/NifB/PqqE/SkfB family radical SAM enzyme
VNLANQIRRALLARMGADVPIYAHVALTHRCNMRCRPCVLWRRADKSSELDVSQFETLAGNLAAVGVTTCALSGGDPFMRKDLPDLTRAFAVRGMDVRILTHGVGLGEERIRAVIEAGATDVSISLDSADPAKVKDLYNGVDVFDRVVESMRIFARLLPRGAVPIMNVVVSRANVGELPRLVPFAEQLGFYCSFVPIAISPSEEECDGFAAVVPDLAIPPQEFGIVERSYSELLRMKLRGAPIANSSRFLKESVRYFKTGARDWACDAGRLYFSVSPEGGISICHNFEPFARHDDPDLAARLRSPELRAQMRMQREQCRGCMRPCWAEMTYAVKDVRASLEAFRLSLSARRRR